MIVAEWVVAGVIALATLVIAWGALGIFAALPTAIAIGLAAWLLWRHIKASQPFIVGAAAVFLLWAVAGHAVTQAFPETANSIAQQQVLIDLQAGQSTAVPNIAAKKEVYDLVQQLDNRSANRVNTILQKFWKGHQHGFTSADIERLQAELEPIMGSVNAAHEMAGAVIENGQKTTSLGQRANSFFAQFEKLFSWPDIILPAGLALLLLWTLGSMMKRPQFQKAGIGIFVIALVLSGIWTLANSNVSVAQAASNIVGLGSGSQSTTITVVLPANGSPSAVFNPLATVPAGWSYRIDDAPVGTTIDWMSGASSVSYKEMANYPAQPFSLSHEGGGVATISWQPYPFTSTGQ